MIACIDRIVTFFNKLTRDVSGYGRLPRRIVGVVQDYCWIQTTGFWLFDLTRLDAPWRQFREQHDKTIRWELATIENCQLWDKSGTDGYTGWQYDLLIRLIEERHIVLVGYTDNSDSSDSKVPDCYGTLALERKPMTRQCSFYMEPNEGTLRTFYTRQQSRGQGLATRMFTEFCNLAAERGLTKVYADIDRSNIASFRAAEKAGAVRIQDITIYEFSFFKRKYIFVRGALKDRFRRAG